MEFDFSELSKVSSLLDEQDSSRCNGVRTVAVDSIEPDPNQPRKSFDEEAMSELAESIQSIGIIQPPVVRTHGKGYLLISGERRWRATRQLGMQTIEVIVRDDLSARAQFVENIQREALTTWEIYRWIASELDAGAKQIELAAMIGKSKQWISAYASIAKMPESLVAALRDNRIEDITALGHLCRLQKEIPEEAARLLESLIPITRTAVADAFARCSARRRAADLDVGLEASSAVIDCADRATKLLREGGIESGHESQGIGRKAMVAVVPTAAKLLPIRIHVHFEGRGWIVNYAEQRIAASGEYAVMIEGDEGAVCYAPLACLKLQSIERL